MTEIIAIKFADEEPSGLNEVANIRQFFKQNQYTWDEDTGVLRNGSDGCIFSFMGPFSLFKEDHEELPEIVFHYILSLQNDENTIVSMIEEDEQGWTLEETVADFYLKDFRASLLKEFSESSDAGVSA